MAVFDPAVYYGHHEAEWGMLLFVLCSFVHHYSIISRYVLVRRIRETLLGRYMWKSMLVFVTIVHRI